MEDIHLIAVLIMEAMVVDTAETTATEETHTMADTVALDTVAIIKYVQPKFFEILDASSPERRKIT